MKNPHTLATGDGAQPDMAIHEFWSILRRRWRLIVGFAALAFLAALVATSSSEPVYSASTLLRIEDKRSGLPRIDETSVVETGTRLETEMGVLRSRMLAEAVVDSLRLQLRVVAPHATRPAEIFAHAYDLPNVKSGTFQFIRQPDDRFRVVNASSGAEIGIFSADEFFRLNGASLMLASNAIQHAEVEVELRSRDGAVKALVGAIEVSRPNRKANFVEVRFRDRDAATARDIANALAEQFIMLRRDAQKAETRSTIEFLRRQLDSVAVQLAATEDQLRAFREHSQVINPGVESSAQVRRFVDLQAERSAIETERTALLRLLNEVNAASAAAPAGAPSPYRRLVAFPTLMRNQVVSDVLRSLSSVENERALLLMRRSSNDPDIQSQTTRIRDLELQLQDIVTTYLAGLASQMDATEMALAQYQQQLSRVPADEVQFQRLSREPEVLARMHALLQTRLTEAEIAGSAEDLSVRIVDAATLPSKPAESNRRLFMIGLSTMAGLVLGFGLAFGREYVDHSVRTRSDIQAAIGVPVLGLIPRIERKQTTNRSGLHGVRALARFSSTPARELLTGGSSVADQTNTALAKVTSSQNRAMPTIVTDAYDRLFTNIRFTHPLKAPPKVLVFTSALPGDGKTTTATNLALTLSLRGLSVVLLDADLRKGTVHVALRSDQGPGLAEVLTGTVSLAEALRRVAVHEDKALHFITTGELPPNPGQLLASTQMSMLLDALKQNFDLVIIDSPPLNIVADAAVLGSLGDGVVVVARAGVTPFEALTYAGEQFVHANAPVLGAVLNDIDFARDALYDPAYGSYTYGTSYYTTVES